MPPQPIPDDIGDSEMENPMQITLTVTAYEGKCSEVQSGTLDPDRMIVLRQFGSGSEITYQCNDRSLGKVWVDESPSTIARMKLAAQQSVSGAA